MSDNKVPLEYTNSLIYELEKAFWDERGKGARFRTTTIGREYFQTKCLPLIKSNDVDEIVQTIEDILKSEGITGEMTTERDERLLRVRVEGCMHRSVEEALGKKDVEPFTCIPANLLVLAIEEKLDLPAELAEIKLVDGACELLLVIFEQRPTLG